jgi:hypothetical protein
MWVAFSDHQQFRIQQQPDEATHVFELVKRRDGRWLGNESLGFW